MKKMEDLNPKGPGVPVHTCNPVTLDQAEFYSNLAYNGKFVSRNHTLFEVNEWELGTMVLICSPSTWMMETGWIQSHPYLYREFKVSLGYMDPYVKQNPNRMNKYLRNRLRGRHCVLMLGLACVGSSLPERNPFLFTVFFFFKLFVFVWEIELFYSIWFQDSNSGSRLVGKCLYPLSHLTGLRNPFKKEEWAGHGGPCL